MLHRQNAANNHWLVVWTPLKNISQLGWLFPIYGKIKMATKPPTRNAANNHPSWTLRFRFFRTAIFDVHRPSRPSTSRGAARPQGTGGWTGEFYGDFNGVKGHRWFVITYNWLRTGNFGPFSGDVRFFNVNLQRCLWDLCDFRLKSEESGSAGK